MISSPGTPSGANPTTVLAADIGSARTRLALFTQAADGRWTVRGATEAISTTQSPREGIMGGLVTAARELEQSSSHTLLARDGSLIIASGTERGADALVLSGSAAPALRLATLASTAEHSGVWTEAASRWSYLHSIDRAVRDPGQSVAGGLRWADATHRNGWSDVAAKLRLLAPDAVLLTGGFDGGEVSSLLQTVRDLLAARAPGGPPLTIVFAGNAKAEPYLRRLLAGRADLRVAGNVLPQAGNPQPAAAGEVLDDLYCQRKLGALNGYSVAGSQCAAPMLSSARALALAWTTLSNLLGEPVLGLDLGATSTIAGLALPDGGYHMSVAPEIGVTTGWDAPLRETDSQAIARWIPIPLSKTEIQTRLSSRQSAFRVPQSNDALLFQEALAREAWRSLYPFSASAVSLPEPSGTPINIVGSGGVVAHAPSLWRVALMLLDVAEPHGIARLWADRRGTLAQTGALAAISSDATRSLLQGSALSSLGLALCLDGATTPGGKAADIEMTLAGGNVRRTVAAWGTIHLLHTAGLGQIELTVRPVRGVYIAGHDDGAPFTTTISNSDLGVVIDCRGRPLAAQLEPEHSFARMRAWVSAGDS